MSAFILIYLTSIFSEGGKMSSQPCKSCTFQRSPMTATGAWRSDIPVRSHVVGAVDVGSWGGCTALQEVPPVQFPGGHKVLPVLG